MKKARLYFDNKWMGETVSEYGIQHNRIDYRCLSRVVGDMVLCNDITKLFYSTINNEYNEVEQTNGCIDNSDIIEELEEKIEELENQLDNMDIQYNPDEKLYTNIEEQIEKLKEQIEELEHEQDEPPEIYQYYIISDNGAEFLQEYTNEIIYYIPVLDIHIWGVTHWGTGWDYVLTDIEIEEAPENE